MQPAPGAAAPTPLPTETAPLATLAGVIRFEVDGEPRVVVLEPGRRLVEPELVVDSRLSVEAGGLRLDVDLEPRQPLTMISAEVELRLRRDLARRAVSGLANGYQSWSLTREVTRRAREERDRGAVFFMSPFGDTRLTRYEPRRGCFHAWSFTWLRLDGGEFLLAASTAEDSGFTVWRGDLEKGLLRVEKDCAGRRLERGRWRALGIRLEHGPGAPRLARHHAAEAGLPGVEASRKATGWTSWYRHYTKISEEKLLGDLEAVAGLGLPLDYFQIDDGYCAVGDWTRLRPTFPRGLGFLAARIREKGMKPGLWLAPFVAEKGSELVRERPGWLLRDRRGRPVSAGWNPNWSGAFYALDLRSRDVRDHLRHVLHRVTVEWGFELVKADFLYAAALGEVPERTRGERMAEALDFLRECLGSARLLGCGVPLGSAAGRMPWCRIGPDVSPYWEDRLLGALGYRERVSTYASLTCTLNRAPLHGAFFGNDPDVFILRRHDTRLSPREAETLLLVNYLLSGILLFSDDPARYGPAERAMLRRGFPAVGARDLEVSAEGEGYRVDAREAGHHFVLLVNLGEKPRRFALEDLGDAALFDQIRGELLGRAHGRGVEVPPHGARLLKATVLGPAPAILGGTAHLLAGVGDVERLDWEAGEGARLRARAGAPDGEIWLGIEGREAELRVGGEAARVEEREGIRFTRVRLQRGEA